MPSGLQPNVCTMESRGRLISVAPVRCGEICIKIIVSERAPRTPRPNFLFVPARLSDPMSRTFSGVVFGRALSEQSFDVLFLDVPQQVAPLGVGDKRRAHHSHGHYDRDPPQNPQPPRPAAARTAWRVALWRPFRPCCTAVRYAPRAVVENVVACHRLPRESPVVPSVRPPGR